MTMEIPDACTLPTAEQPLRLAEFDALFTTAVRHVDMLSPTQARMGLTGAAGLAATVRDLAARETACWAHWRSGPVRCLPAAGHDGVHPAEFAPGGQEPAERRR